MYNINGKPWQVDYLTLFAVSILVFFFFLINYNCGAPLGQGNALKNWRMPLIVGRTRYSLVKSERIVCSMLTEWLSGFFELNKSSVI
jgi:hypothetical protein